MLSTVAIQMPRNRAGWGGTMLDAPRSRLRRLQVSCRATAGKHSHEPREGNPDLSFQKHS